jgi:hypothetical protein
MDGSSAQEGTKPQRISLTLLPALIIHIEARVVEKKCDDQLDLEDGPFDLGKIMLMDRTASSYSCFFQMLL